MNAILTIAMLGVVLPADLGLANKTNFRPPEKISAPVVYKDLMLILTSKDGVAAIAFGADVDEGINYRYRVLPNGSSKEQSGSGKVFEKYQATPTEGPYRRLVTGITDLGSQLFITAGPIRLEWSYSVKGKGWIYYQPEEMRVQIAHSGNFETIDLNRFKNP